MRAFWKTYHYLLLGLAIAGCAPSTPPTELSSQGQNTERPSITAEQYAAVTGLGRPEAADVASSVRMVAYRNGLETLTDTTTGTTITLIREGTTLSHIAVNIPEHVELPPRCANTRKFVTEVIPSADGSEGETFSEGDEVAGFTVTNMYRTEKGVVIARRTWDPIDDPDEDEPVWVSISVPPIFISPSELATSAPGLVSGVENDPRLFLQKFFARLNFSPPNEEGHPGSAYERHGISLDELLGSEAAGYQTLPGYNRVVRRLLVQQGSSGSADEREVATPHPDDQSFITEAVFQGLASVDPEGPAPLKTWRSLADRRFDDLVEFAVHAWNLWFEEQEKPYWMFVHRFIGGGSELSRGLVYQPIIVNLDRSLYHQFFRRTKLLRTLSSDAQYFWHQQADVQAGFDGLAAGAHMLSSSAYLAQQNVRYLNAIPSGDQGRVSTVSRTLAGKWRPNEIWEAQWALRAGRAVARAI